MKRLLLQVFLWRPGELVPQTQLLRSPVVAPEVNVNSWEIQPRICRLQPPPSFPPFLLSCPPCHTTPRLLSAPPPPSHRLCLTWACRGRPGEGGGRGAAARGRERQSYIIGSWPAGGTPDYPGPYISVRHGTCTTPRLPGLGQPCPALPSPTQLLHPCPLPSPVATLPT